jgi:hypothetical protein
MLSVMVFAQKLGQRPAVQQVKLSPEWQRHVVPFERFGTDASDWSGLLFSGAGLGPFGFWVDEVGLE